MFLVLIIYQKHRKHKENTVHYSCNKCSWCFWCQWCSMYRYYQTLTLKRHPGGRSSWCPFHVYAPFLVCIFRRFSAFLPIFSDFFRVKRVSFPSRESAGKKEGSRHSTPKTYSKRPRTSPFSHSPGKQALYFAFYGVFRAWVV